MLERLLITLFLVSLLHEIAPAEKLKLCVVETARTTRTIRRICPRFQSPDNQSQVECVIGNDRFNCLRQLSNKNADFTVLEPEDLVAAAANKEYDILVTTELRGSTKEKQKFEMVVIARKNIRSISDIKGKRFCHPGLQNVQNWRVTSDHSWTKAFSTFFEDLTIPLYCYQNLTLLENRLTGLSEFFESSCIAGPWAADSSYDNQLKARYKNLCAACDVPATCYVGDKYFGREGALLCLTDNAGDIAWNEGIYDDEYNYLCIDSTTRPWNKGKPCVWITRPWPVVVARSEIAEKVARMLDSNRTKSAVWEKSLEQVLTDHTYSVRSETFLTPEDFLRTFPNFVSAYNRAACRPSRRVHWCVASNLEDRKCRWLREASTAYGIEPPISCIQESSRMDCLEAIREGRADLFVAKPEELLEAKKKGLSPMVHGLPGVTDDLNRIAAVVKRHSRFQSLKDLKGAKACFPGYKGVAWNAFASVLRNMTGPTSECSEAKSFGNFFKESCVLGLNDSQKEVPRNLYSLCKQAGRAGDDISTFDCLSSGLGDVAFVNLKSIEKKTGKLSRTNCESDYRTLCVAGANLKEDKPCLLTWTPLCSVVTHGTMEKSRWDEIYSMLLQMDNLFGTQSNEPSIAFSMYGMYDSNHSVIFPEGVQKLQAEDHRLTHVKAYTSIVDDIGKLATCGSATNWRVSNTVFLISLSVIALNQLHPLLS